MNFDINILEDSERILFALRSLYRLHGFVQYRMGKFEEYDLYSRNKDFLVSDRVITFTDTDGKLMALKPDVTLSIIKNNRDKPEELQKLCYNENVYRVSRGTGTFREIMQTGLECIGAVDSGCIREVLYLATESLSLCGRGYALEVTDLDILTRLIEKITVEKPLMSELMKCAGEKNRHGILSICHANGIPEEKASVLLELLTLYGQPEDVLPRLEELCQSNGLEPEFDELTSSLPVDPTHSLVLDFSLTGDIAYYNGIFFRGYVEGIPDCVLSGGQYDRLMWKMGRRSKAVGFAVYLNELERLSAFREEK